MVEHAPHTLHGWYALHQVCRIDRAAARTLDATVRASHARELAAAMATNGAANGWSVGYELVGGAADVMLVHFRDSLDQLAAVARRIRQSSAGSLLHVAFDFVSVAEAALYHATVEAATRGTPGSPAYEQHLAVLAAAEAGSPRMQHRLQPPPPGDWRYVCFYPMNRRRAGTGNWYALPLEERSRMLHEHGLTGRRYAGRIVQIITGATGLSDWEWGVTLFAQDPLDMKRIVTDMRYDEASARYAEFGSCFTGVRLDGDAWF